MYINGTVPIQQLLGLPSLLTWGKILEGASTPKSSLELVIQII